MSFRLIQKSEFDKVRNAKGDKYKKLQLFSDMCRFNTLVMVKKAGSGHLGSSLSAADIVTYLYLERLNIFEKGLDSPDRDIYFSSKGHDVPGLYSLFYALGILPEEKALMLRRLGGVDGHPEVRIPGVESSTGSLGMGIAKGKGMAWAKTYAGNGGHVYVLTGDGEFQEGQIWESLQVTAHQKVCNITVIMDHNKYQTDMLVKDVNNIEDLTEKITAFGWHVVRINGHDFETLDKTFSELDKVTDKPKFIIADTIKGKGVNFMEKDFKDHTQRVLYKWHSGAPEDQYFHEGLDYLTSQINGYTDELGIERISIPHVRVESGSASKLTKEFVTEAYGNTLVELAETNKKFVVLDGDLSADCKLRKFEYTYPNRFIENGIAEQDMVSMAGGLAHMGLIPIVNTFASFLAARGNEQIYNNATEKNKIIYTCHFSGMIPAGPGKSHQSVRDISLFGALPNVTIVQPCNATETRLATKYFIEDAEGVCVLRLVIGPSPEVIQLPADYSFEVGKGSKLTEGKDGILFGYGPVMLHEALVAADFLTKLGYSLMVINMPWLNKIDPEWLKSVVSDFENIYVLEDHSNTGGLGDRLLDSLTKTGLIQGRNFTRFGLDDYPECGTPLEVLEFHELDGKSLAKRILGLEDIDHALESSAIKEKYTDEAPQ
ncbi:MAG: thiamine pyrophosphate-dependent enzyme [Ignavibacteriaceae bacterium]|nr:thiamine pyrophosphate-dependent enzyme [Ignavibacteriaceae bacterium]